MVHMKELALHFYEEGITKGFIEKNIIPQVAIMSNSNNISEEVGLTSCCALNEPFPPTNGMEDKAQ